MSSNSELNPSESSSGSSVVPTSSDVRRTSSGLYGPETSSDVRRTSSGQYGPETSDPWDMWYYLQLEWHESVPTDACDILVNRTLSIRRRSSLDAL